MKILVTGVAGFIGFHVARYLLQRGDEVVGIDNLNDYYDPSLKEARLGILRADPGFQFTKLDIADEEAVSDLFRATKPASVIHLAAQAGVRYSIQNPRAYINSNIVGFHNILEACREYPVKHLVFASSSSVYGANTKMPYSVHDNVDHPINLYAASKKSNELMAHAYSHLYGMPTTGLRFFTVYGPWGRPDMATYTFTRKILAGDPIDVYNGGDMSRDFTYVDDIVQGLTKVHDKPPAGNATWNGEVPDPSSSRAPYRIYNIGNHSPNNLLDMISILEGCLGKKAIMNLLPMQAGDIPSTYADIDDISQDVDFHPSTGLEAGLTNFVQWYRDYHKA